MGGRGLTIHVPPDSESVSVRYQTIERHMHTSGKGWRIAPAWLSPWPSADAQPLLEMQKKTHTKLLRLPLTRAEIMRPVSAAHGRRQLLATREGQLAGAHVCQPRLRRPLGMMALFPGSLVSSPSGST